MFDRIPAIEAQLEARDFSDPAALIDGYARSVRDELPVLLLSDWGLFASDVPAIIEALNRYGVKQVGIDSESTALLKVLWGFSEAGAEAKLQLLDRGLQDRYGEMVREFVPGFLITLP